MAEREVQQSDARVPSLGTGERPMRILMIGYVWPEPESSAAGVRDWALMEVFRDAGFEVTFASSSRANDHASALERAGCLTAQIAPNDPAFDAFIGELNPDFVIFDRFVHEEQFGWRVRKVCPEALRILDTQDLHFLRKSRADALSSGESLERIFAAEIDLRSDECLREIAAIYRSDLTWLCSDFERDLLIRSFGVPDRLLQLASFFYPPPGGTQGFADRSGFVSIGNFRHAPNADGVRWLREKIWPEIRARLPGARVDVYGAYPSREMMALTDARQGFHVKGPAAGNVGDTLCRYRVNLAPLRFGAGIKGKIAEGWRVGTPVVSTPIGSEGMTGGHPFGGVVVSDPAAFAEAAVQLHEEALHWESARKNGQLIVGELFSRDRNGATLVDRIQRLRGDLSGARRENLVGELLWYQGNRSTEYFSRWIELKNRPNA